MPATSDRLRSALVSIYYHCCDQRPPPARKRSVAPAQEHPQLLPLDEAVRAFMACKPPAGLRRFALAVMVRASAWTTIDHAHVTTIARGLVDPHGGEQASTA